MTKNIITLILIAGISLAAYSANIAQQLTVADTYAKCLKNCAAQKQSFLNNHANDKDLPPPGDERNKKINDRANKDMQDCAAECARQRRRALE